MTSEVCCVIWIINKRAHCVQLIDSKAKKAFCTSENLQKYYCLEKMAPTVQQLSAEFMTEAEKEAEEDRFLRKSKQSPFIPIGE